MHPLTSEAAKAQKEQIEKTLNEKRCRHIIINEIISANLCSCGVVWCGVAIRVIKVLLQIMCVFAPLQSSVQLNKSYFRMLNHVGWGYTFKHSNRINENLSIRETNKQLIC